MRSILTPAQSEFLRDFFASPLGKDFFLSGGTALAEYYLQHRLSQDLDLFSVNQNISFDSVNAEIQKIFYSKKLTVENQVTNESFLRYFVRFPDEILKIDIIKDVPISFGKIQTFSQVKVDSLENIAVGKLLALFGRADPKDFVDLYFLFEKEKLLKFDDVLTMAKKKDLGLQELYLAEMFYKVETIEIFPKTLKTYEKRDLVGFFLQWADGLLGCLKPAE